MRIVLGHLQRRACNDMSVAIVNLDYHLKNVAESKHTRAEYESAADEIAKARQIIGDLPTALTTYHKLADRLYPSENETRT